MSAINITTTTNAAPTIQLTQARDAYQLALATGFVGTLAEWLESQKGADGPAGPNSVTSATTSDATASLSIQNLTLAEALPVESGGTGGNTTSSARTALGLGGSSIVSFRELRANRLTFGRVVAAGGVSIVPSPPDAGFSRLDANSIALGNGETNDATGSLTLANLTASGTITTDTGVAFTGGAAGVTRTALGLGTGDSPTFGNAVVTGDLTMSGGGRIYGNTNSVGFRANFATGTEAFYLNTSCALGASLFRFIVNSTECLRGTTIGLSIKTGATPTAALDVNGDGKFSGNLTASGTVTTNGATITNTGLGSQGISVSNTGIGSECISVTNTGLGGRGILAQVTGTNATCIRADSLNGTGLEAFSNNGTGAVIDSAYGDHLNVGDGKFVVANDGAVTLTTPLPITSGGTGGNTASTARTALKVPGSDPTGIPGASPLSNIISISQANYDALAVKDPATLYVIA